MKGRCEGRGRGGGGWRGWEVGRWEGWMSGCECIIPLGRFGVNGSAGELCFNYNHMVILTLGTSTNIPSSRLCKPGYLFS